MASNIVPFQRLDDDSVAEARPDALDGDFDAIYRRFYPRLVALCRRRAGDDTLAEDVAQETLIRALTHRDVFDRGRPAWPWLKTIATNLIVDHYRKQVRETALRAEHGGAVEDPACVEETDLLRRAIERLPRRQRAAVALRYLNDWDAQDAASFMGVTRPAYEQLLFRARRRLKTEYSRLSQEVSAGIATGTTALRVWARRAGTKAREIGGSSPALADLTSITGAQFAGGALALLISLGAQPMTAPPADTAIPVAARAASAERDRDAGRDHAGRARVHAGRGGSTTRPAEGAGVTAPQEADRTSNRPLISQMTNDGVEQPEDVHITSVALASSPGGVDYAAGRADCPSTLCPAVLFQSRDGGATWDRLPAEGFDSETLLVPASGGPDEPIFALGRMGLQVSRDGGSTFTTASPPGVTYATGSAAISPAFADGDPTILIGAQTLMRYRDDLGVAEPAPWATGSGPLQPAYAPQYPADDRVMVGGLMFDARAGRLTSAVHTCAGAACTYTHIGGLPLNVHVRPAPDFAGSDRVFAFTARGLFGSTDGGGTFDQLTVPRDNGLLADVAVGPRGRLLAAVGSKSAGMYVSDDGGASWTEVAYEAFAEGASVISVAGDRAVAALHGKGLACSKDGGITWAARCAPTV
jgi:RNA polymerase sigma-70 factor, ECF subfamily